MTTQQEKEKQKKSFWETAPGLLTAFAALMTAIGGCVAVLVSSPVLIDLVFSPSPTPLAFEAEPSSSVVLDSGTPIAGTGNAPSDSAGLTFTPVSSPTQLLSVQFPDGSSVTMLGNQGSKYQYTVLSAQREPLSMDKHLLHLRIRAWHDYYAPMNFWNDSFRLVIGDLRLAPVSYLNEAADRDETVDGDVIFEIDASVKEAVLVIKAGRNFNNNVREMRLVFP
jgi:hypothetical protein